MKTKTNRAPLYRTITLGGAVRLTKPSTVLGPLPRMGSSGKLTKNPLHGRSEATVAVTVQPLVWVVGMSLTVNEGRFTARQS